MRLATAIRRVRTVGRHDGFGGEKSDCDVAGDALAVAHPELPADVVGTAVERSPSMLELRRECLLQLRVDTRHR
jgi:hypothetical protein